MVAKAAYANGELDREIVLSRVIDAPGIRCSAPGSILNACSNGLARAGFAARFAKSAKPRPARCGDST